MIESFYVLNKFLTTNWRDGWRDNFSKNDFFCFQLTLNTSLIIDLAHNRSYCCIGTLQFFTHYYMCVQQQTVKNGNYQIKPFLMDFSKQNHFTLCGVLKPNKNRSEFLFSLAVVGDKSFYFYWI